MKKVENLSQGNTVWNFESRKYYVDEEGNLYNSKGILSNNGKDKDGYIVNTLMCSDKKWRPFKRHRIIYETFNGLLEHGLTVNHDDENRLNNRNTNLSKATREEQVNHGTRNLRSAISNGHKVFYSGIEYYSKAEFRRVNKISERKMNKMILEKEIIVL